MAYHRNARHRQLGLSREGSLRPGALPLQPAPAGAAARGISGERATNFLPKVSGVPLGAARAAIDYVIEMMQTKVEMPSGRPYKNMPRIQSVIAEAEMMLGAARAYVFSAMERRVGAPGKRRAADGPRARRRVAVARQRRAIRARDHSDALRCGRLDGDILGADICSIGRCAMRRPSANTSSRNANGPSK